MKAYCPKCKEERNVDILVRLNSINEEMRNAIVSVRIECRECGAKIKETDGVFLYLDFYTFVE